MNMDPQRGLAAMRWPVTVNNITQKLDTCRESIVAKSTTTSLKLLAVAIDRQVRGGIVARMCRQFRNAFARV